jgi:thioredoxin 1
MHTLDGADGFTAFLSGRKAVVLFHASWCGFCRRFRPIFAAVADAAPGWEAAELALEDEDDPLWDAQGVEFVPTVIAFRDGRPLGRLDARPGEGLTEADLRAFLAR